MKRILKRLCALLLFVIFSQNVNAQLAPLENVGSGDDFLDPVQPRADIIAHSPEVEAMTKYAGLPVTLYTGMPQISVPIFDIKTPGLTIPFSLSYNYNGFRPTEQSTSYGLGWSLQGGGAIARVIKSIQDGTKGVGNEYADFIAVDAFGSLNQQFLTDIALGNIDSEPDVYIFNFGEYSGKFILIKGVAYLFPFQNIKITSTASGFTIIDDKGNTYLFNDTETTFVAGETIPNHISSWQLSKIITDDKRDTISYSYTGYGYKQNGTLTERISYVAGVTDLTSVSPAKTPVDGNIIRSLVLTNVTSRRYGSLSFVPSSDNRLDLTAPPLTTPPASPGHPFDKIVINKPDGTLLKEFALVHNYFGNNSQLKLKEVLERQYDNGNPSKPLINKRYSFEYQNESSDLSYFANRYAIDKWGYYNGANSNQTLFDQADAGLPSNMKIPFADRAPDSTYSSYGIIKKMIFPTGGYSTFIFEQNKVGTSTLRAGPGLRIQSISSYDNVTGTTPALIKRYSYNNGVDLNVMGGFQQPTPLHEQCIVRDEISVSASMRSALSDLTTTQFYYRQVTESTQDATKTGKTVYTFTTPSSQLVDVKLLSQTDYKFSNQAFTAVKNVTNAYHAITKNIFNAITVQKTLTVGTIPDGVRCQLLTSPDETQASALNDAYGLGLPQNGGQYSLVSDYTLLDSTSQTVYGDIGATPQTTVTHYYYDNPDHVYPTRITMKKSNGDIVTQALKYPLDYNFNSCVLPDAINSSFKTSLQNAIQTMQASYNSLKTALQDPNPPNNCAHCVPYYPNTGDNQTAFTTVASRYHLRTDLQNAIATGNTNRDNSLNTYLTCLNNTIASGSLLAWQQSVGWMQLNNVVSPVIERYVSITKSSDGNEYLLSAVRNEYGIFSGLTVEPTTIKQTEINSNVLKTTFLASPESYYRPQLFFTYDKGFNLVTQQKNNDIPVTYLYGYNQTYPIAEIKNASFASVLTALSLTQDQYITEASASTPSTNYLTKINALRQNLASSVVTVYTFNPLIGVKSIADPNNQSTNYEYDNFQRLKFIKDNNQNIMKAIDYNYQLR